MLATLLGRTKSIRALKVNAGRAPWAGVFVLCDAVVQRMANRTGLSGAGLRQEAAPRGASAPPMPPRGQGAKCWGVGGTFGMTGASCSVKAEKRLLRDHAGV